jgi:hypothetical protein
MAPSYRRSDIAGFFLVKSRKQRFFEKKRAKNFYSWVPRARPARESDMASPRAAGAEVFWFFFSKKNRFPK